MKWSKGDYEVTDYQRQLDLEMIHGFLTNTYWARGITANTVERSIANSLAMGVYHKELQIGFGRVVTDRSTFAYLADVFILPGHRGLGLGRWLVECFLQHPELQGLRLWLLATADAHGLYEREGFTPLKNSNRFMERGP